MANGVCKVASCSRPAREDDYCSGHSPARQREARRKNPQRFKQYTLKRDYGISYAQYNELLEQQKGCCAICGYVPKENDKKLAVDHCHETGLVRGLLCSVCNLGIGSFKDSVLLLKQAVTYLERPAPKVNVTIADKLLEELMAE